MLSVDDRTASKNMIYVIHNRELYEEDREIFFVEASEAFQGFFQEVLVPWQRKMILERPDECDFFEHKLVMTASVFDFPDGLGGRVIPISAASYLAKNCFPTESELTALMVSARRA